jgi:hypothetical protein
MKVRLFCLVTVVLLAASQASAAVPSEATLAAMGLSGLEVMSDAEGLAVRGFGYRGTSANGKSFAVVSTKNASAGSQNSYSANGKKFSFGANESYAGVEIEVSGGHGGGKGGKGGGHGGSKPQSISINAYGGGFSIAKTK